MAYFKSERQLLEAIEKCQLYKITQLVKQGQNIHKKNTFGQNFLVYILQQQQQQQQHSDLLSKKRFQLFQFLITNYNVNIHSFDSYGKNLFNWATNLNCTQEALYLLNSNPGDLDILARDRSGSCSLHYAVEHGNDILVHTIVNYLLRYRLRFDIKDAYKNTPEDLAGKLGYDKIRNFLSQACRSTVFMSREIPYQRLITPNSKAISSSSSSLFDSSEYFSSIESRINAAKSLDDWKTVAALRDCKKNLNEKPSTKTPDPLPKTSIPKFPPINIPSSRSPSQAEELFDSIETQLTPSFRRSFVPIYQRSIDPNITSQRIFNPLRKLSQTSSRRVSSVISARKRDSEASQMSVSTIQDVQNRHTIPPVYKQYHQTIVTTN